MSAERPNPIPQKGNGSLRNRFDHAMDRLMSAFNLLAIPVIVLLFLQWPLRDGVQAGGREANDQGQWLFALYIASSIVVASRQGAHLSVLAVSRRYSARTRQRLYDLGLILGVLPWALFVMWSGWPLVLRSIIGLERFPETANPGYFLVKTALLVMAVLISGQALRDLLNPNPPSQGS